MDIDEYGAQGDLGETAQAVRPSIIRSLLVTCRLHEVDAWTCLVDVLRRISVHPAKRAIERTPRMAFRPDHDRR